jgi:hypothetical protein
MAPIGAVPSDHRVECKSPRSHAPTSCRGHEGERRSRLEGREVSGTCPAAAWWHHRGLGPTPGSSVSVPRSGLDRGSPARRAARRRPHAGRRGSGAGRELRAHRPRWLQRREPCHLRRRLEQEHRDEAIVFCCSRRSRGRRRLRAPTTRPVRRPPARATPRAIRSPPSWRRLRGAFGCGTRADGWRAAHGGDDVVRAVVLHAHDADLAERAERAPRQGDTTMG